MTHTMSASAAKVHLAEALREVEAGESVTITRNGRPVAVLVPPELAEQLGGPRAAEGGLAGLIGRYDDGDELSDALDQVMASRSSVRGPHDP